MNESTGRQKAPRKNAVAAPKGRGKTDNGKQSQPVQDQLLEAEDIARAVYDGMQDLRTKKSS